MLNLKTALLLTIAITSINSAKCPDDEYCVNCDFDNSVCQQCFESFLVDGECKEPTTKVTNCVMYSSLTACDGCALGYKLKDNKCVDIVLDNCLSLVDDAATTEVCETCDSGYKPVSGKCDETVKCTIANCDICSVSTTGNTTVETCEVCSSGYSSLNPDNLKCETKPTDNCWFT